jgi:hypothetical protein
MDDTIPRFFGFDEPQDRNIDKVLGYCEKFKCGENEDPPEPAEPQPPTAHAVFQEDLRALLDQLFEVLTAKNRAYGNSALSPIRVFSRASAVEQINVRIDDKLSRLRAQDPDDIEDTVLDLIGYLCLRRIATGKSHA